MINGKIFFLLLLIAICVAFSYAEMWLEWRNRAVGRPYVTAINLNRLGEREIEIERWAKAVKDMKS